LPDTPAILRQDDERQGRWYIRIEGEEDAEMTYRRWPGNIISIDHTYVPEAFRGKGVAEALMQAAIAAARDEGLKVRPLCSYAVLQFRRHPEWSGLLDKAG
jgi:predicted GNAT family acetyltransferase